MEQIRKRTLRWYTLHRRSLPWRLTRDPYRILVSEVMLQQTQVDRVILKYKEFLKKFPTIRALAMAKTAEVIRAWKGLGYNRRALYLQKTAQAIVRDFGGKFPREIEQLKQLPAIGDYTARALLSFSFGNPVPMMDTNHRRFYQRVFFGIQHNADSRLLKAAMAILPKRRAYDWNQALMDFGSLVCLTRKPKCDICPIQQYCKAYPNIGLEPKSHRTKFTPFRETDRYFRGRIIDRLRTDGYATDYYFKKQFPELSLERYVKIITGLEKDGLINRLGKRIVLP